MGKPALVGWSNSPECINALPLHRLRLDVAVPDIVHDLSLKIVCPGKGTT